MRKSNEFIFLLMTMTFPVNMTAKVVSSVEYNGYTYDIGYVCDFQVDGIYYTIQDSGVYVSAEKYMCDSAKKENLSIPWEVIVNNSYKGVVTIPETVNYGDTIYDVIGIDNAAFKGCNGLYQIVLPISLRHIGRAAFYGCSSLRQLNIPLNVSEIDNTAFELCVYVDTIYWDSPLVSPRTVLYHCSTIKYFKFGSEIKNIPPFAFANCVELTSITIPEKVEFIGEYAFNYCWKLKKVEFEGCPNIYVNSFSSCLDIDTIVLNSCIPPIAINNTKENYGYDFVGPSEFFEEKIYESAMLCIPEGSYDEYAVSELWSRFISLNRMNTVDYNGHSYYIRYESDFQIDSIFYLIHENGVYVSAEKYLCDLENDTSLLAPSEIIINSSYHGNITIPETVMFNDRVYDVVGIDMGAFKNCKDLLSVAISDKVNEICEDAFSGCSNLKTVKFPALLYTIGKEAFKGCSSLESVSFPDNLSFIGESSFRDCIKLESIFFQNCYMNGIEEYAFAGCKGLNYINIPSGFSSYFKPTAFDGCIIDSVYWNSFNISPSNIFSNKSNCIMKHVYVDDARDYIYTGMFSYCDFFSVTISSNIKYIERSAFLYCNNLNKIVLEGSTEIHNGAFMYCDNIDTIVIESSRAPSAIDMTYGRPILDYFSPETYENAVLLIPIGSKDEYMSSPLWSRFSSVIEIDFDEHESDLGNDSIFYYVHEDGDTIYYAVHEDGIHVVSKSLKYIGSGKTHGFDDPLTPRDPMAGGLQPRFGTKSDTGKTIDTLDLKTYSGSVVIPESVPYKESIYTVTCIDKYAFAGSRDLVSVSLPESVNQLGYGCFAGCSGLTEITIPKSVRVIDEYAFAYCTGLKRVIIEGNPEISETAFIGCGTELEVVMTRVEKIKSTDTDFNAEGAVHYGVDGRKIPADAPGLHLIKYKDGTVRKASVR